MCIEREADIHKMLSQLINVVMHYKLIKYETASLRQLVKQVFICLINLLITHKRTRSSK